MGLPRISINISVVKHGNPQIVLDSLKHIDYPRHLMEIIVVEGNQLAKQRNYGITYSKGDLIYLLDDDSQVQPDALRILAKEFADNHVAAVGGPSISPTNVQSTISKLIGYVLETHFGALRMRYRYSKQNKHKNTTEDHLIGANLAVKKNIVQKIGGFSEHIIPNEETELLRRMRNKGYLLRYNEDLFIYREQRNSIKKLIKQFKHYGRGRMKQIFANPKAQDGFFSLPIFFGFYIVSLLVFHPVWYFLPILLYIALALATSSKAALKYKKMHIFFAMPLIFPVVHLSYGLGLLHETLFQLQKFVKLNKVKTITYSPIKLRIITIK